MSLLIGFIVAWLTLHYKLTPHNESAELYNTVAYGFLLALPIYGVWELLLTPYLLDREQRGHIEQLTLERNRLVQRYAIKPGEWRPLSGQNLVDFITAVAPRYPKNEELSVPVKFIAGPEGRIMAGLLANAVRTLGYDVMRNQDEGNYIFAAEREIQGIVVRYGEDPHRASVASRIHSGLIGAGLTVTLRTFANSDQFKFVQVEIGQRKSGSQWD